jgi:hypothetical protein
LPGAGTLGLDTHPPPLPPALLRPLPSPSLPSPTSNTRQCTSTRSCTAGSTAKLAASLMHAWGEFGEKIGGEVGGEGETVIVGGLETRPSPA